MRVSLPGAPPRLIAARAPSLVHIKYTRSEGLQDPVGHYRPHTDRNPEVVLHLSIV